MMMQTSCAIDPNRQHELLDFIIYAANAAAQAGLENE
jgi:hypothetical protein